jgi:hypothetical protein
LHRDGLPRAKNKLFGADDHFGNLRTDGLTAGQRFDLDFAFLAELVSTGTGGAELEAPRIRAMNINSKDKAIAGAQSSVNLAAMPTFPSKNYRLWWLKVTEYQDI